MFGRVCMISKESVVVYNSLKYTESHERDVGTHGIFLCSKFFGNAACLFYCPISFRKFTN